MASQLERLSADELGVVASFLIPTSSTQDEALEAMVAFADVHTSWRWAVAACEGLWGNGAFSDGIDLSCGLTPREILLFRDRLRVVPKTPLVVRDVATWKCRRNTLHLDERHIIDPIRALGPLCNVLRFAPTFAGVKESAAKGAVTGILRSIDAHVAHDATIELDGDSTIPQGVLDEFCAVKRATSLKITAGLNHTLTERQAQRIGSMLSLRCLEVSCFLGSEQLAHFSTLRRLERLAINICSTVSRADRTAIFDEVIGGFTKLTSLALTATVIDPGALLVVAQRTQLASLELHNCASNVDTAAAANSGSAMSLRRALGNLTSLTLDRSPLCTTFFGVDTTWDGLTSLSIACCADLLVSHLHFLANHQTLTSLVVDFSPCKVDDTEALLRRLSSCARLKALDIAGLRGLSNENVGYLAALSSLTSLRITGSGAPPPLMLDGTSSDEDDSDPSKRAFIGIAAITKLSPLKLLTTLHLFNVAEGDDKPAVADAKQHAQELFPRLSDCVISKHDKKWW